MRELERCRVMTREEFEAAREPREEAPYAPDWQVLTVEDKGPGEFYRYVTTGINHNYKPGEYGREFSWSVPQLSWRYYMAE
jgi:hypothetical protein